jgi:aminomethyltransferase
MALYGHELSESIDPLTAGLSFAVKLNAVDFIGKTALEAIKSRGIGKERVGLELAGKRIAREGSAVFLEGLEIGQVTSGTFSPTLQKPIAMAYLEKGAAKIGQAVDIRGKREAATLVSLPFYRRPA